MVFILYVWDWLTVIFTGLAIIIGFDHDQIDFYRGRGRQLWYCFIALAPFAFARMFYFGYQIFSPIFK